MKKNPLYFLTVALLILCVATLNAQEKKMEMPAGLKGTYVKIQMSAERELVSLAEAIPQEKLTWRPMEGVRSIAESFLHAAGGNYIILTTIGGKLPEGVDMKTLQSSTTDKAKIVEALKKSFATVNEYVSKIPESDYEKHVSFFGRDMTMMDMIVFAGIHAHETLGQAIAYARMNGVVPPWTAETQERMKKQEGEKK